MLCRGRAVDKMKVSVAHPNGEVHYADLSTTEEEHHVVKGEGGGTYRVCFQNLQPKASTGRVEV